MIRLLVASILMLLTVDTFSAPLSSCPTLSGTWVGQFNYLHAGPSCIDIVEATVTQSACDAIEYYHVYKNSCGPTVIYQTSSTVNFKIRGACGSFIEELKDDELCYWYNDGIQWFVRSVNPISETYRHFSISLDQEGTLKFLTIWGSPNRWYRHDFKRP